MFPGRFSNVPETMWNFGWNPQTMGFAGQFCGGDPMTQVQQSQTQAQLAALQHRMRCSINSFRHKINLISTIFNNYLQSISLHTLSILQ